MNLSEEQRRARLLKSRAERLPEIKKQYEEVEGSEATYVRVNFDSDNELHNTCYNNEWYGGYWVI